jgi:hypothetical protein
MSKTNAPSRLVLTNQDLMILFFAAILLVASFNSIHMFQFLLLLSLTLCLSIFNQGKIQIIIALAVITCLICAWKVTSNMVFGDLFVFVNLAVNYLGESIILLVILGVLCGFLVASILFRKENWFKYNFFLILIICGLIAFYLTPLYAKMAVGNSEFDITITDYVLIFIQVYLVAFISLSMVNSACLGISFLLHGTKYKSNALEGRA